METGPIWISALWANGQLLGGAAEVELDDVADGEGQADADDHHGHQPGAAPAQRPPEACILGVAEESAANQGQEDGQPERQTHGVEGKHEDGAQRHHLAVGEVGKARGAEDQGQADGGQGQQEAEAQPGDQSVEEVLAEVLLLDHDALAEGEDDRQIGGLAERDVAGVLLAIGQLDALRQGGLVQFHSVGALFGDADVPGSVGVRRWRGSVRPFVAVIFTPAMGARASSGGSR